MRSLVIWIQMDTDKYQCDSQISIWKWDHCPASRSLTVSCALSSICLALARRQSPPRVPCFPRIWRCLDGNTLSSQTSVCDVQWGPMRASPQNRKICVSLQHFDGFIRILTLAALLSEAVMKDLIVYHIWPLKCQMQFAFLESDELDAWPSESSIDWMSQTRHECKESETFA